MTCCWRWSGTRPSQTESSSSRRSSGASKTGLCQQLLLSQLPQWERAWLTSALPREHQNQTRIPMIPTQKPLYMCITCTHGHKITEEHRYKVHADLPCHSRLLSHTHGDKRYVLQTFCSSRQDWGFYQLQGAAHSLH